MLTYGDVKTFLQLGLAAKGYATLNPAGAEPRTMPLIDPGPAALVQTVAKKTPGALIIADVGNGAGLTLEGTYDQTFITLRVLGPQNDYASAAQLMHDVDLLFLAVTGNGMVGGTRVLYVTRTGGAPQLIDFDASNRYHFQTTYITPAATGL